MLLFLSNPWELIVLKLIVVTKLRRFKTQCLSRYYRLGLFAAPGILHRGKGSREEGGN